MGEKYIQVGITALRDPATGKFLPSVPLFIKETDEAKASEKQMIDYIGKLFAFKMKEYKDGCQKNRSNTGSSSEG